MIETLRRLAHITAICFFEATTSCCVKLRLTLSWFPKHEFAELGTLNLTIYLICKLTDVLRKHGLLCQLLTVVLLHVSELGLIRHLCVINYRFDIVFQLLHDVLILQLCDIHVFSLYIRIEQGALLG